MKYKTGKVMATWVIWLETGSNERTSL